MRTITLPGSVYDDGELAVRGLWFTPDGRQLVAATGSPSASYRLHWWDLARDRHAGETFLDPPEEVRDAIISSDPAVAPGASLYAVPDWDEEVEAEFLRVYRFRYPDRPVARTVPIPRAEFGEFAFTPSGRHLMGRAEHWGPGWPALVRWPIPDDLPARPPPEPVRLKPSPMWTLDGRASGVGFAWGISADGRRVAAGTLTGDVAVWSFPAARWLAALRVPRRGKKPRRPHWVAPVAVSPTGAAVAAVDDELADSLVLWDARDPDPRAVMKSAGGAVEWIQFSPDGRRLVAVPWNQPVRVIDPAAGVIVGEYDWGVGAHYSLAFAPDGLTAAVGGDEGRIAIWDVDG